MFNPPRRIGWWRVTIFPRVYLPPAGIPGAMQDLIRHGGLIHHSGLIRHGGSGLDTSLVEKEYSLLAPISVKVLLDRVRRGGSNFE